MAGGSRKEERANTTGTRRKAWFKGDSIESLGWEFLSKGSGKFAFSQRRVGRNTKDGK